jgi:hypothetical protein
MRVGYYTYAYIRKNGTPYYIGKGINKRAYCRTSHKSHGIYTPPDDRILLLKANLTEEEAFKHEIYMISIFGRVDTKTGILYNKTSGGDKPPKAKKGQINRNIGLKRYWDNISEEEKQERCLKVSRAKKGKGNNLPTCPILIVELDKKFDSIKEAAQYINGCASTIVCCLNNRGQNKHRGYTFKRLN